MATSYQMELGKEVMLQMDLTVLSQSYINNSSKVRCEFSVISENGNITASDKISITLNSKQTIKVDANIGTKQTKFLGSIDTIYEHSTNGTLRQTIDVKVTINGDVTGSLVTTVNEEFYFNLPAITRASLAEFSDLILPNNTLPIKVTSIAGNGVTSVVKCYVQDKLKYTFNTIGTVTTNWTITDSEVLKMIKENDYNAKLELRVTCESKSGNIELGKSETVGIIYNIRKPLISSLKSNYNIFKDSVISWSMQNEQAGLEYKYSYKSSTLSNLTNNFVLSSTIVQQLLQSYKMVVSAINEKVSATVNIYYKNNLCKTLDYDICTIVATVPDIISSITNINTSYEKEIDTELLYDVLITVSTKTNELRSDLYSFIQLGLSVPSAKVSLSSYINTKNNLTTLTATRANLNDISKLDPGDSDFQYVVNCVATASIFGVQVYSKSNTLTVYKRGEFVIDGNNKDSYGGVGTKVYLKDWSKYSESLTTLFYSNSPIPQVMYIPILKHIPTWSLTNVSGKEIDKPLLSTSTFNKLLSNFIDDKKTLTMLRLLCMYEENQDSLFYKPHAQITESFDVGIVDGSKLLIDSSGYGNITYTKSEATIVAVKYHSITGIPCFETSDGDLLVAYIGRYRFDGIQEIRILPLNIEQYLSNETRPTAPVVNNFTIGDLMQPSRVFIKENGQYYELGRAEACVIIEINDDEYGILLRSAQTTNPTIFYTKAEYVKGAITYGKSVDINAWYTDGLANKTINSSISETFSVKGYAGGIHEPIRGDIIEIAKQAKSSYFYSSDNDLANLSKRFYLCLGRFTLSNKQSYSNQALIVEIDGVIKCILEQDVVGTKVYYDSTIKSSYPPTSPIYTTVTVNSKTPQPYVTWNKDIDIAYENDDIQGGRMQISLSQYTPPKDMQFKQRVISNTNISQVYYPSVTDIVIHLKDELPSANIVIQIIYEDLFNNSTAQITKNIPLPYLYFDTKLKSVGILKYPTKANAVDIKN